MIIFFKLFEQTGDTHHKRLLNTADTVIQEWGQVANRDPARSRLAAMSGLLSSFVNPTLSTSPVGFKDFFPNGSSDENDIDPLGLGHLGFDGSSLDPMWFELV